LICDDGPGEIADFIHLASNGDLSFIHVKKADSKGISRRFAVGPYEVVTSQATKNLIYFDSQSLRDRLEAAPRPISASWVDGARVADRTEFLEMLQCRGARDKRFVVIVQPHVSEAMYKRHQPSGVTPANADEYRLMLLETLLNGACGPVSMLGGRLTVIGSLI
jgi:hypothetical protein